MVAGGSGFFAFDLPTMKFPLGCLAQPVAAFLIPGKAFWPYFAGAVILIIGLVRIVRAKALEARYLSMVIPARWFAGGKGLDEFRESMLADDRLRSIDDYLSASDVFPGVGLKGGVSSPQSCPPGFPGICFGSTWLALL